MMRKVTAMNQGTSINRMAGILLLDVVLGIVIFVVGMLALAHLQGNLTRSSADANTRTVAANVAEEFIEAARAFQQVPTDPDGLISSFNDIVTETQTVTRGGIEYTAIITVKDYYYDTDTETFIDTQPDTACPSCVGLIYPDFKYMEVEVVWNANQQFQISEGVTTSDLLGSGSITFAGAISSMSPFSSARVTAGKGDVEFYQPVPLYEPGLNPDTVSLDLGNYRFKESSTPVSEIDSSRGIVETWFNVNTFFQSGSDTVFLRGEEFVNVACECVLLAATEDSGRRPTVFDGAEYTEGEFVSKAYGERPDVKVQSNFCDQCCRDHHDGGTGANDQASDPGRSLYNPFKSSSDYHSTGTFAGDHKHYAKNVLGNLVEVVTAGDEYLEACRLVRKDGFFRVAQDFRQEGLFAFPEDYLDSDSEISEYSAYVQGAVTAFEAAIGTTNLYESNPPTLLEPAASTPAVTFPASTFLDPTSLPNAKGSNSQQLRSRGIYIDYLSDDLRLVINCLEGGLSSAQDCGAADNVLSAIEVIPSFDVQLTSLTRWNETPINQPVDVTNEPILTDNAHRRGLATRDPGGSGITVVETNIHKGTLGFTGTDPIIPADYGEFTDYDLYVSSPNDVAAAASDTYVVSGFIISSVNEFNAADLLIEGSEARCGQTNIGYECAVEVGAVSPTMTVSGYKSGAGLSLTVCSTTLTVELFDRTFTTFSLSKETTSSAHVSLINSFTCPVITAL